MRKKIKKSRLIWSVILVGVYLASVIRSFWLAGKFDLSILFLSLLAGLSVYLIDTTVVFKWHPK